MPSARLHRYLWLLTGRCEGFRNAALNTFVSYEETNELEHVGEARDVLGLRRTDTDYYTLSAMAALYASLPALRGLPTEESVLFSTGALKVPTASVDFGTLVPQDTRPVSLIYRPTSIPAAHQWKVLHSGDMALITGDNGQQFLAPTRLVGGVAYVDWPSELDFSAAVSLPNGVWSEGSHFTLTVEPCGYPYAAVARRIKDSGHLVGLMAAQGTLEGFHSSLSPVHKVGALVAAVVRRNLKLSPSMQGDEMLDPIPGPAWTSPTGVDGSGEEIPLNTLAYLGDPLAYLNSYLTFNP